MNCCNKSLPSILYSSVAALQNQLMKSQRWTLLTVVTNPIVLQMEIQRMLGQAAPACLTSLR